MSLALLEDLSRRLRGSAAYARLRAGASRAVRLPVPAAAWVVDSLAAERGRPALVVVPREADALAWVEAAALFGRGAEFFPAPALTPYQELEVSLPVRAQEIVALDRALAGRVGALVATPRALFRRLPPARELAAATVSIAPGSELSLPALVEHLAAHGYSRTDLVAEIGEFAVRGGVFDCHPPGEPGPVRVDLFGDEVETLHRFDPVDQRSHVPLEAVRLLPLALFGEGREQASALATALRRAFAPEGPEAQERLADLAEGHGFPGWHRLLPLLAGETAGLEELLPGALVVAVEPEALAEECAQYAAQLAEEHAARAERGRLAVPPALLERPLAAATALLARADLRLGGEGGGGESADFEATTTDLFHGQLPRFPGELETARRRHEQVVLVAPAEQQAWLAEWLEAVGPDGARVQLVAGELARGFRLPAVGAVVFGERQLFPRRAATPDAARRLRGLLAGMRDLKVGDYVVHRDHGIGQFLGLRTVGTAAPGAELPPSLASLAEAGRDGAVEVMEIAYAGDRRLLRPLARLDAIERYSGLEAVAPRLDQLGGTSWSRTKERVRTGMRRLATDLLRLAAERRLARALALAPPGDLQAQFEAAFEYEETPDQEVASRAIQEDLSGAVPMDRLLCGDVGFGKTEVAMRAAFRVVEAGHQVAVLAPTTILADQHLATFSRRFAGFPVAIDMISRFRSPAEIRALRERLAAGQIDILIGTHRLLSRDIDLPRLALLVIDEEQRFGVAQKEKLRELKKSVHVLSMTATPVPRTLQLSLAGVRDLSVIETPPRDRMAVETAIVPFSAELVREAVAFERQRGGQVYFVFNRVEGIEEMAEWLREALPGVRLTVGHGQLPERQLADRMHAFSAGEHDLLLATTIIENGIDIPNVNTMLIHRADRFGLAQLYQLRGRVGRSRQLGFCYLLVGPDRVLSAEARERLEAIREFTELGSGFRVAARDLEIRGAGNLLGAEQSGHITAVGMETYMRMLEETVRELQGEEVRERPSAVIDLPVAMGIPRDYLPDANLRMEVYRRIAAGEDAEEEILAELADRFGRPPPLVRALVAAARLKRRAEELGVQAISFARGRLQLRLRRDNRLDLDRLVSWIGERRQAAFSPSGILTLGGIAPEASLESAATVLAELSP